MAAHQKYAKKQIKSLKDIAVKRNIPFHSKIKQGTSPVKEIINFTKTHRFDFIVMGSHGRNGFLKIVMGSVANRVLNQAPCPVLVVK